MATITAIDFNFYETIPKVQPHVTAIAHRPAEYVAAEHESLRMQWVQSFDSNGRRVLGIQWSSPKARQ